MEPVILADQPGVVLLVIFALYTAFLIAVSIALRAEGDWPVTHGVCGYLLAVRPAACERNGDD